MERKSPWKNSGGRTCVRAAQDAGFKRCCLRTGKYDGGNRNYFFPGVALWSETDEGEAKEIS